MSGAHAHHHEIHASDIRHGLQKLKDRVKPARVTNLTGTFLKKLLAEFGPLHSPGSCAVPVCFQFWLQKLKDCVRPAKVTNLAGIFIKKSLAELGPSYSPASCAVLLHFQFSHLLVLCTAYITGPERFVDISCWRSVDVQDIYNVGEEKNHSI